MPLRFPEISPSPALARFGKCQVGRVTKKEQATHRATCRLHSPHSGAGGSGTRAWQEPQRCSACPVSTACHPVPHIPGTDHLCRVPTMASSTAPSSSTAHRPTLAHTGPHRGVGTGSGAERRGPPATKTAVPCVGTSPTGGGPERPVGLSAGPTAGPCGPSVPGPLSPGV